MNRTFLIGAAGAAVTAAAAFAAFVPPLSAPDHKPVAALPAPAPAAAPKVAPQAAPQAAKPGPSFDVVTVGPDGTAVIAGRATPGATVTVTDGVTPLGQATADRRGEWVLLPSSPLTPGSRELGLVEASPSGPLHSDRVVVLVVPERQPAPAVLAEAAPAGALAVAVPRDGAGGSTLLQAPPAPRVETAAAAPPPQGGSSPAASPPVPPGGVTLETMDYDESGYVALGGRGKPGGSVQVYLDNLLVGRAHTDPEGRWRLAPERAIDPGVYTLRADQVTEAGKVTARVELPVQVSQVPPDLPAGRTLVVQPGNSLWRIARRTYGEGLRYTTIYEANRAQIRDADRIYPGQIFTLPVAN